MFIAYTTALFALISLIVGVARSNAEPRYLKTPCILFHTGFGALTGIVVGFAVSVVLDFVNYFILSAI